ncbi:MAG TPA: hypothetical protein DCR14_18340 [Acidimicrobiaceae bacterium]|nr:hypothetical protein [Acidimicrobiaceae bacterium]
MVAGLVERDHLGNGTVAVMYAPFVAAHEAPGHVVRWATWDGEGLETVTIRWENEGFTVNGAVGRERIEYVLRLSPTWQVRQFILFRDLPEPDLWLATDGHGRWGEMNGAHRTELDGCYDVLLPCTPFTHALPVRRLPLLDGHTADVPVVTVDVETLEVLAEPRRLTRVDSVTWRFDDEQFEVDDHGLPVDLPGRYRRVS